MADRPMIPCIVYAAKSTQDKRGSIPEQLRQCREAIDADPRRRFIAEYKDEAFSAYRRDRGPGLRDATQHAEDLAAQHGIAELWAQHSDRIARGDGRAARHTVEIALWGLKSDVRVRTLQDPETFADLLYAVVTGQRNNEDSKRKALATQAGRRRAVQRGEHLGYAPDGYRNRSYLDQRQQPGKRLEFDPERRPLLELIFRLALRARTCGQIAASVNDAGWRTKPARRVERSKPFDHARIHEILTNPRYAALATYRGEVLAQGNWPAYVSERQHRRIGRLLAERDRGGAGRSRREAYLLERIARCGHCGSALHALTGTRRRDGSIARRYVCASHTHLRGRVQCDSPPIEAHTAEAMVIESLDQLLLGSWPEYPLIPADAAEESSASIRARLHEAVLAQDEHATEQAIEALFERVRPHAALLRQQAGAQRKARELAEARRLRAWLALEKRGRTEATREQSTQLTKLLRSWFVEITIAVAEEAVTITATRRQGAGEPPPARAVRIDRVAWTRGAIGERCQLVRYGTWAKPEILAALQAWADTHGRSPWQSDWRQASAEHPHALTVTSRLGSWERALRLAKLPKAPQRIDHHPWTQAEIVGRLRAWKREHGRPPRSMEWWHAAPGRPSSQTVRFHFGSWENALAAAGLQPLPRPARRRNPWSRDEIVGSVRAWTDAHGRPPRGADWIRGAPGHPSDSTVRTHFGSWGSALAAARPTDRLLL